MGSATLTPLGREAVLGSRSCTRTTYPKTIVLCVWLCVTLGRVCLQLTEA